MKKYLSILLTFIVLSITWLSCKKSFPVDEDGLLITTRQECYVSNFEILGSDFITVRNGPAVIDTTAQTITVQVLFGTDLKNLYPQFSLVTDAKLSPKITGKVDFSDLTKPKIYTVISGDRKIKKPYTILLSVQPR